MTSLASAASHLRSAPTEFNPSKVCTCCRPPLRPRRPIPQATCDAVRSAAGLVKVSEPWRGPHAGIEPFLIPYGKSVIVLAYHRQMTSMMSTLIEWGFHYYDIPGRFRIIFSDIRRASQIVRTVKMMEAGTTSHRMYHVRMGLALGYTKEQILAFINQD